MGATVLQFPCEFEGAGCCITCGIEIILPRWFKAQALKERSKKPFFCPNGHSQHFIGETEAERLAKLLDLERQESQRQRERVAARDRSLSAVKGQITKIKNRVGNGVCPCCNRSFTNLRRHMSTKHPAYKDETE